MKNFILVATYTYPHEYLVLKFLLNEEEIPFFLENETMITISPFYSNALGGIKLYVHKDYVTYVKELIQKLDTPNNDLKIV
ncbi:DUF2007 domain-containing protein [Galbibacter pacificus]|uniref:DUF2007 domain-containing protein n=1 Tax=Galbibacter pacificus TaxID=2996052 RepID=A0ABT6FRN1_9FLAO|nr:DUF2007 domain-containing protein [Galbibacter pacificus]MDG3582985.1 DUF2007 domain-containing protein [Galbibacter pacificus]MDG3585896.1 DUF2007 domain-containing protein [Galbibacter pacificus]